MRAGSVKKVHNGHFDASRAEGLGHGRTWGQRAALRQAAEDHVGKEGGHPARGESMSGARGKLRWDPRVDSTVGSG